MEFGWPLLFWMLPLPLLFRKVLPPVRGGKQGALKVPFFSVIQDLPFSLSFSRPYMLRMGLLWVIWILLVTAAADPHKVGGLEEADRKGRSLLLAVDISASMSRPDVLFNSKQVARFEAVRHLGADFLTGRRGDRVGLILFGTLPYLYVPPTFDTFTASEMLKGASVGLAGDRTAIGDTIALAVKTFEESKRENRVLVLLTDGANTAGSIQPIQALSLARYAGVRIFPIAFGGDEAITKDASGRHFPPDPQMNVDLLKELAQGTGGRFFNAAGTQALKEVYRQIESIEPVSEGAVFVRPVKRYFFYPLGAALFLSFLLAFIRIGGDPRSFLKDMRAEEADNG